MNTKTFLQQLPVCERRLLLAKAKEEAPHSDQPTQQRRAALMAKPAVSKKHWPAARNGTSLVADQKCVSCTTLRMELRGVCVKLQNVLEAKAQLEEEVEGMQAMQAAESSAKQQAAERLQQAEAVAERLKRAAAVLRQEAQGTAVDNLALVKQLQHLRNERDSAQQQCQQLQERVGSLQMQYVERLDAAQAAAVEGRASSALERLLSPEVLRLSQPPEGFSSPAIGQPVPATMQKALSEISRLTRQRGSLQREVRALTNRVEGLEGEAREAALARGVEAGALKKGAAARQVQLQGALRRLQHLGQQLRQRDAALKEKDDYIFKLEYRLLQYHNTLHTTHPRLASPSHKPPSTLSLTPPASKATPCTSPPPRKTPTGGPNNPFSKPRNHSPRPASHPPRKISTPKRAPAATPASPPRAPPPAHLPTNRLLRDPYPSPSPPARNTPSPPPVPRPSSPPRISHSRLVSFALNPSPLPQSISSVSSSLSALSAQDLDPPHPPPPQAATKNPPPVEASPSPPLTHTLAEDLAAFDTIQAQLAALDLQLQHFKTPSSPIPPTPAPPHVQPHQPPINAQPHQRTPPARGVPPCHPGPPFPQASQAHHPPRSMPHGQPHMTAYQASEPTPSAGSQHTGFHPSSLSLPHTALAPPTLFRPSSSPPPEPQRAPPYPTPSTAIPVHPPRQSSPPAHPTPHPPTVHNQDIDRSGTHHLRTSFTTLPCNTPPPPAGTPPRHAFHPPASAPTLASYQDYIAQYQYNTPSTPSNAPAALPAQAHRSAVPSPVSPQPSIFQQPLAALARVAARSSSTASSSTPLRTAPLHALAQHLRPVTDSWQQYNDSRASTASTASHPPPLGAPQPPGAPQGACSSRRSPGRDPEPAAAPTTSATPLQQPPPTRPHHMPPTTQNAFTNTRAPPPHHPPPLLETAAVSTCPPPPVSSTSAHVPTDPSCCGSTSDAAPYSPLATPRHPPSSSSSNSSRRAVQAPWLYSDNADSGADSRAVALAHGQGRPWQQESGGSMGSEVEDTWGAEGGDGGFVRVEDVEDFTLQLRELRSHIKQHLLPQQEGQ